jgi:hypothetical protein
VGVVVDTTSVIKIIITRIISSQREAMDEEHHPIDVAIVRRGTRDRQEYHSLDMDSKHQRNLGILNRE